MTLRHSYLRAPGGRRYGSGDRALARQLEAAGAPSTLSDAAIAAMSDPDGIRVVADVMFELESNRFGRPTTVEFLVGEIAIEPETGDAATVVDGFRNSADTRPAATFPVGIGVESRPGVRLSWEGVRYVNRVEVHGDPEVGQITKADVYYVDESGDLIYAATGEAPAGRLVVDLPELVACTEIRVTIREATGNPIAVVEVDPMWIYDVSDQVETVEVEFARETDPGAAADPVGNYEASTMTMSLDDTEGFWNPALNASLDVGHRVEVAYGVRYRARVGSREVARNEAAYPSAEGEPGPVGTSSGSLSLEQSTDHAWIGNHSYRTFWNAPPATVVSQLRFTQLGPYPAGTTRTFRIRFLVPASNTASVPRFFQVQYRDDGAATMLGSVIYLEPDGGFTPGEWNTLTHTFTVPPGRTLTSMYWRLDIPDRVQSDVYYWDGFQINAGPVTRFENLCVNPSIEAGGAWNSWNPTLVPISPDTEVAFAGSRSRRSVTTTSSSPIVAQLAHVGRYEFTPTPIAQGNRYQYGLFVRVLAAGLVGRVYYVERTSTGADVRTAYGDPVPLSPGEWVRLTMPVSLIDPRAVGAVLSAEVRTADGSNAPAGVEAWFDAAMLVEGDTLPAYFDGSTDSTTEWTGTANASTSVKTTPDTIQPYFDGDNAPAGYSSDWLGTPHASASRLLAPIYGSDVEELLPAGVFYTEPFDTDSDSTTVTITGVDRLGRHADVEVSEEVQVDATVEEVVSVLAAKYLDLDETQIVVSSTIAGVVLPYAYPSGNLGTYLADLAKATGAVVHMDPLGRLVLARRSDTGDEAVAEFTSSTNLVRFRRPPGYDSTTSIVNLTAAPLTPAAAGTVWSMPPGGITIAPGATYLLVARYEEPPVVGGSLTGIVADGSYEIVSAAYYSNRAEVEIRNPHATQARVIADLHVHATPLVEGTLSARKVHEPSVRRYGPRAIDVEARLIQTPEQLDTVASVLLDAFRSIDDQGNRRLPDVEFDALGLLHVSTGDRVTLSFPGKGLGGDYTVLARRLVYADGALLMNGVRVRESPSSPFLILDVNPLDDVFVLGY